MTNKRKIKYLTIAGLALIAGIAASWIVERFITPAPPSLQAGTSLVDQSRPLPSFTLTDQAGRPFTQANLADHWSFLFFGYTHCPDVCPVTLAVLNQTVGLLEQAGNVQGVQVVFVSVDPQRDTSEKLAGYVTYFDPNFIGVTGDEDALNQLTEPLGILHAKVANPNDAANYLVDHSAVILLIDPQGRLAAVFSAPHDPQRLAHDFIQLRSYTEHRS